jgi:hypothetical protein
LTAFLTLSKGFLFISRVAFILNLLFFVCLFLRHKPFITSQELVSILLVAGWFLSVVVNFLANGWLLVLLLTKEKQLQAGWMIVFNAMVFIFQLIYFFL